MESDLKEFIENYKHFIANDDWGVIYDMLDKHQSNPILLAYQVAALTDIWHKSGIDPLDYLSYIPKAYFFQASLDTYFILDHISTIRLGAFEQSTIRKVICPESLVDIK